MAVTTDLARLAESPVNRLGRLVHSRLPARGLEGLDPDVARVVVAAGAVDTSRLPAPLMRGLYRLQTMLWNREREEDVRVEDERVNRHVTVRTYTPYVEHSAGGVVYFHGGGMMIGDLETHDRWCRWVAVRAGIVVHAVDYRLVPEHPAPAGAVDALVAWNHVVAGWQAAGRPLDQLGVGGDSAGGYLSALVATQAVDPTLGVPVAARPAFQWLLYPGVDLEVRQREAHDAFPTGVLLTGPVVARFSREWSGDDPDVDDPYLSPGRVPDHVLAEMPPTHLVTCRFDPLTAENEVFAARLEAVGVPLTRDHFDDLPHEFISMTGVSASARAAAEQAVEGLVALAV